MRRILLLNAWLFMLSPLLCHPAAAKASPGFVVEGRILDVEGKPVEGGEVFVYHTCRTRMPADFISPKTVRDGLYRLEVPAGKYWIVARVRNEARYGPLGSGGKHSGEAEEIDGAAGGRLSLDFTVADVREMARKLRSSEDDFRVVEGRILDQDGRPVRDAYAFARREGAAAQLPEFLSAWTDEDGRYTLHLPSGRVHLGASTSYPPEDGGPYRELEPGAGTTESSCDIRIQTTKPKAQEVTEEND